MTPTPAAANEAPVRVPRAMYRPGADLRESSVDFTP